MGHGSASLTVVAAVAVVVADAMVPQAESRFQSVQAVETEAACEWAGDGDGDDEDEDEGTCQGECSTAGRA